MAEITLLAVALVAMLLLVQRVAVVGALARAALNVTLRQHVFAGAEAALLAVATKTMLLLACHVAESFALLHI